MSYPDPLSSGITRLSRLESLSGELAAGIRNLVTYCRNHNYSDLGRDFTQASHNSTLSIFSQNAIDTNMLQPSVLPDDDTEVDRIRRSIFSHLMEIQNLLQQPTDFLQQLSKQNQLLACLRWLGEFQVLTFIPLEGSVPMCDVADLAGVPENSLSRIVEMTGMAGFLQQPQPGHVAHTAVSAPFVTKPSLLDAALFISEVAAPSALSMAAATQNYGVSQRPNETAYNIAFHTPTAFANACEQRPRLQRQWPAYLRFGTGNFEASMIDILSQYDWSSLGSATVIEVGALSTITATALAALYPLLRFVVQMSDLGDNGAQLHTSSLAIDSQDPRLGQEITVQQRAPRALQTVLDGAVYVIHLSTAVPTVPSSEVPARVVSELQAHIGVLRVNRRAVLLLVTTPLFQSGSTSPDVEVVARLRDFSRWQLANSREMEMTELVELLNGMGDNIGRLAIVKQYSAPNNAVVALEVRYQTHAESQMRVPLA